MENITVKLVFHFFHNIEKITIIEFINVMIFFSVFFLMDIQHYVQI